MRGGILCGSPLKKRSCTAAFSAVLPYMRGELRDGILCGSPLQGGELRSILCGSTLHARGVARRHSLRSPLQGGELHDSILCGSTLHARGVARQHPLRSPLQGGELHDGILCGSPLQGGELRGGILCSSPRPYRGGVGGGVSIVISHVCFRLFEKFAAKVRIIFVKSPVFSLFLDRIPMNTDSFVNKIHNNPIPLWHFRIYLIHNTLQEREFYSEQTQSLVGVNCEFSPGKLPFYSGQIPAFLR